MATLAYNRKAGFDYEILETYEAGLVLRGFEVKAVKTGHMNLAGSFVVAKGSQMFLINAFIPPYQPKNTPSDYDPYRSRTLLLNRAEIASLTGKTKQKGLTLAPLKVYTKRGKIKLEFAVARGKRKFDKREKIKSREEKRKIERAMKENY